MIGRNLSRQSHFLNSGELHIQPYTILTRLLMKLYIIYSELKYTNLLISH